MGKSVPEFALTCPFLTVPIAAVILHSPFPLRQRIGVTGRRIQIVRDVARPLAWLSPARDATVNLSIDRSDAVSVAAAQLPVFKLDHYDIIGCEPFWTAARLLYGHIMVPEWPVKLMRAARTSPQSDAIARRNNRSSGGSRRTLTCCADKHGQQRHTSEFYSCIVHDLLLHSSKPHQRRPVGCLVSRYRLAAVVARGAGVRVRAEHVIHNHVPGMRHSYGFMAEDTPAAAVPFGVSHPRSQTHAPSPGMVPA